MGTGCDIARFIFYFFLSIFASGLVGVPWDLFLLDSISLPEDSSKFQDDLFQLLVFGALTINGGLTLLGELLILHYIVSYLSDNWSALSPGTGGTPPIYTW